MQNLKQIDKKDFSFSGYSSSGRPLKMYEDESESFMAHYYKKGGYETPSAQRDTAANSAYK